MCDADLSPASVRIEAAPVTVVRATVDVHTLHVVVVEEAHRPHIVDRGIAHVSVLYGNDVDGYDVLRRRIHLHVEGTRVDVPGVPHVTVTQDVIRIAAEIL